LTSHGDVVLKLSSAINEPTIILKILNAESEVLESITRYNFEHTIDRSTAATALNDMYQKARWQALGVEKAVDTLLNAFRDENDEDPPV
jgi:hypothetical protein